MSYHRELVHNLLQVSSKEVRRIEDTTEFCYKCDILVCGRHAVVCDRLRHKDEVLADAEEDPWFWAQEWKRSTRNLECMVCILDPSLHEFGRFKRYSSEGSLNSHLNVHVLKLNPETTHPCMYPSCPATDMSRNELVSHLIEFHGVALAGYNRADGGRAAVRSDLSNLIMNDHTRALFEEGYYTASHDQGGAEELEKLRRTKLGAIASTLGIRHTGPDMNKATILERIQSFKPSETVVEILEERASTSRVLNWMARPLRDGPFDNVRSGLIALKKEDLMRERQDPETVMSRQFEIERELKSGVWTEQELKVRKTSHEPEPN